MSLADIESDLDDIRDRCGCLKVLNRSALTVFQDDPCIVSKCPLQSLWMAGTPAVDRHFQNVLFSALCREVVRNTQDYGGKKHWIAIHASCIALQPAYALYGRPVCELPAMAEPRGPLRPCTANSTGDRPTRFRPLIVVAGCLQL
jgi:hypothetical protein